MATRNAGPSSKRKHKKFMKSQGFSGSDIQYVKSLKMDRYGNYIPKRNPELYDAIRPGSRVSIVNRFGQVHSGRAVMRGPHGWVLNMGGPHGRPDIATPENVVKVSGGRRASNPETLRFRTEALARKWADALRRVGAKGVKLFKFERGAA